MTNEFFKFPQTPHILWLGEGSPRGDKLLSADGVEVFENNPITVEEKIDGANVGFSLDESGQIQVQNRGEYVRSYTGQYSKMYGWLGMHSKRLTKALEPNLIAFGEWCAAKHSLEYTKLDDWWTLFDVYDKDAEKFYSVECRNEWAFEAGVSMVPQIAGGHFTVPQLRVLMDSTDSVYRDGSLEGIVVRYDSSEWLESRAKMVRANFTQTIEEHWSSRALEWNELDGNAWIKKSMNQ